MYCMFDLSPALHPSHLSQRAGDPRKITLASFPSRSPHPNLASCNNLHPFKSTRSAKHPQRWIALLISLLLAVCLACKQTEAAVALITLSMSGICMFSQLCVCVVNDLRPLFCTCAAQTDTGDHLARMDLTVYSVHLTSAHGRSPLRINHGDLWQPNPAGGDS